MNKKITQFRLLAATIMFVAAMVMPSTAWAQNTITPKQPSNGDGSENSPYQIGTAAELYWFAALVIGDTSVEGVTDAKQFACARLTTDITVNSAVLTSDGSLADNRSDFDAWTPIGSEATPYRGTFDGNNHTISGLYFNDVYSGYAGLFGCNAGKIINVGVIDSYFKGTGYIGGVCGYNYAYNTTATIENCYNTGTIIGSADEVGGVCGCNYADSERTSTIKNCYNTGMVSSSSSGVYSFGGVCGKNYANSNSTATIESSYNTGTVSGRGDYAGGVCGKNYAYGSSATATIKSSYNTGMVSGSGNYAGGVCGQNYAEPMENGVTATIESCYNTGTISGSGNYVGGICGQNYTNSYDGSCCAIISKCYYNSYFYTGNVVGNNDNGSVSDVEGKITAQFMSGEVCYLLNGGYTYSVPWHQNLSAENGDACPVPVVEGTTPYTVYQVDQLCSGGYNVGKTYANNNEAVTLDHHIQSETVSFNSEKKIYNIVCKGEGCGYAFNNYYADAAGTIEATPNAEKTEFTVANYPLQDATTYDNKAVFTATKFTYTRTFNNTNWTTWYVPFDLTLTSDICAQYDFSRINNVHQYDTDNDGTADKTVVESFRQMPGVTLKANYPYLVKPVSERDLNMVLNLEGVIPALAETNYIDCQSVDFSYTFTGTYTAMGEGGSSYYDPYTLWTDGTWQHFRSLDPMRHYLTVTPRNPFFASAASLRSIMLSVIGDEGTTGIVNMYSDERKAAETYDLGGRRLPAGASQKGVMIENGKVIIKK